MIKSWVKQHDEEYHVHVYPKTHWSARNKQEIIKRFITKYKHYNNLWTKINVRKMNQRYDQKNKLKMKKKKWNDKKENKQNERQMKSKTD